jgi:surface protein
MKKKFLVILLLLINSLLISSCDKVLKDTNSENYQYSVDFVDNYEIESVEKTTKIARILEIHPEVYTPYNYSVTPNIFNLDTSGNLAFKNPVHYQETPYKAYVTAFDGETSITKTYMIYVLKDFDADGIADKHDQDDDNDGRGDLYDDFPFDPNRYNAIFDLNNRLNGSNTIPGGGDYTGQPNYYMANTVELCGDINTWDTSKVTDMNGLFYMKEHFNCDISNWDVSNVTNMNSMFSNATVFNNGGVTLTWKNTSNVLSMNEMFVNAESFNQDISSWDTSNVTDMSRIFRNASSFNQNISSWNISQILSMDYMFSNAISFNSPLEWDTSNITSMDSLFFGASVFNQDISAWDVSNVTNFYSMFGKAIAFNNGGNPLTWADTSKVRIMDSMFYEAKSFNQNISSWNISQVVSIDQMFDRAIAFDSPLEWDTSNITSMERVFSQAYKFNQDISSWNVSNVTKCSGFNYLINTNDNQNFSRPNFSECNPN